MKRASKRFQLSSILLLIFLLAAMPVFALPTGSALQSQEDQRKNIQVAFASAARTASANSSSFTVNEADTLVMWVSNTATSGTSPTLDVKMQDSPDGGTTFVP